MFLKIFCGSEIYPYEFDKTFFVTESYGGMMYLQFDISPHHKVYKYLLPETVVEYEGQQYLVKGINERKSVSTINCEIDLTGLNSKAYDNFISNTESFSNVCKRILDGTGWTVVDAELVSRRTTLELTDVTTLDILNYCTNSTAYGTCYKFDSKNKIIYCIKPENNTEPTGTYFTDELNLKDITYKGSSSGLVTKLYPFGKDGLDIKSVNDGKRHIENHSYTDAVITQVWRDERYTDAQSLYDDAVAKLNALAVPESTYTITVSDLAQALPDKYGEILNYALYDIITLIDRNRKTRVNHRIVETKRYPKNPMSNTISLSTAPAKVSGKITALNTKLTELNAQQLHDRTKVNEIKQDLDTTVLHVSDSWASSENESIITQTAEGLFLEVNKVVGTDQWGTLIRQSANDIVFAWNQYNKYIEFSEAQIKIKRDDGSTCMSLYSDGLDFIDSDGNKTINVEPFYGTRYYQQGKDIGFTAVRDFHNTYGVTTCGLNDSGYIGWAYSTKGWEFPTMKWFYTGKKIDDYEADRLYAGCDVDLLNHRLREAVLADWGFEGGMASGTISGYIATSYNSDGTAAAWKKLELKFKDGILQSGSG